MEKTIKAIYLRDERELAETLEMKQPELSIEGDEAALMKGTSYKGLWKVSFTLQEF